jgi:hypothetical protein
MRAAALVLVAAVLLAGCETKVIKQDAAEQGVADIVARQTGFGPTDVKCPSGVKAKVGVTYDCHFTGPEPKPYVAHVRITKVQGQRVLSIIKTRPIG